MEITQEQKMYAEIIQKAWEDAEFKKRLVNNPVETIENLTGKKINIPADKKIVVRDQTDESVFYINIPAKTSDDIELSDDQLEMVAGGMETGTI
jgi:hypothetical protein